MNSIDGRQYSSKGDLKQKFPTPTDLRDYCYNEAVKDKEIKECNASEGWCDPCLWYEDWTQY